MAIPRRLAPLFVAAAAVVACLGAARGFAAQATLYLSSTSTRIPPATNTTPAGPATLGISGFADGTVNDELSFNISDTFPGFFGGYLYLTLPDGTQPGPVGFGLDTPGQGDSNLNGLTDFDEVGLGFTNQVTTGSFAWPNDASTNFGAITATWTRPSGSVMGSVALRLTTGQAPLIDLTFHHEFEIYQYKGTLSYTPSPTGDDAYVTLERLGAPGSIQGPLTLGITNATDVGFAAGAWTNESGLNLRFYSSEIIGVDILRGALPGEFYGEVAFVNGLPEYPFPYQFQVWDFDLFDPNDVNGNGVPDIADAGLPQPLAVVTLESAGTNQWTLGVSGPIGVQVSLESATSLAAPHWMPLAYPVLTDGLTTVSIPPPATQPIYFRVH